MDKSLTGSALYNVFDDRTLGKLMKQAQGKGVQLDLFDSSVTNQGIKSLATSENSKFIQTINMGWNFSSINDASLREIADSKFMENLKRLELTDSDISDEGISIFASSKNSQYLEELILYGDFGIGDLSLKSISSSDFMTRLVHLDLRSTCISDKGMELLCKSKNTAEIRYLDVSMNYPKIGDSTLIAIAYSKSMVNLSVLKCSDADISNRGIEYLAESPNMRKLEILEISSDIKRRNEKISDTALFAIAGSEYISLLHHLDVRSTGITSRGLYDLFISNNSNHLRTLKISWNKGITDVALSALADSKKLGKLKKIYVNETEVSAKGINTLKEKKPWIEIIH